MAGRCGCGDNCSCSLQGEAGIDVTGTGARTRPYKIAFNGSDVVGEGLQWDAVRQELTTKLAPSGGLAYNAAGAIYATGEGGGGGGTPGALPATVAALEQRADTHDVVAGVYGAGFMIKPAMTRGSVEYATRRGLDAMHVPVMFLRDGTPVVSSNPTVFGEQIQDQDHERWRIIENAAGVWPSAPRGPTDPIEGWFGFLEPNEYGLMTCAEVFEKVHRDIVLILELRFPQMQAGNWAQPTPDERVTAFIDDLLRLIRRYAAQQSIVVVSSTPDVPQENTNQRRDVLRPFYDASVTAVGPVIATPEAAMAIPPEDQRWSWWRWSMLGTAVPVETMKRYTALPDTYGLVYLVSRHHEHEPITVAAGAAGALAADPDYYAGAIPSHPRQSGYRYRKSSPTWWYSTVDHGLFPPQVNQTQASARIRGFMPAAAPPDALYMLGEQAVQPDSVTHFVLQGYLCPLPDAQNYQVSWNMDLEPPVGAAPNANALRAEVALAVNTDHALTRWEDAEDTSGYIVSYRTADSDASKWLYVYAFDPQVGSTVERVAWNISDVDSGLVGVRVRVNPDRVEFAVTARNDPATEIRPVHVESATGEGALPAHRGGYVYFGRQAPPGDEPVRAIFHGWRYAPGRGDDPGVMQRMGQLFQ